MPVMQVRVVRMVMRERLVVMGMGMRFGAVPGKIMLVTMMRVMRMGMSVIEYFMDMAMRVALNQVQQHAG